MPVSICKWANWRFSHKGSKGWIKTDLKDAQERCPHAEGKARAVAARNEEKCANRGGTCGCMRKRPRSIVAKTRNIASTRGTIPSSREAALQASLNQLHTHGILPECFRSPAAECRRAECLEVGAADQLRAPEAPSAFAWRNCASAAQQRPSIPCASRPSRGGMPSSISGAASRARCSQRRKAKIKKDCSPHMVMHWEQQIPAFFSRASIIKPPFQAGRGLLCAWRLNF